MKKKLFVCLLIVMVILSCAMVFQFQTVTAENWSTEWRYRKSHVINPASGAGTNYQVRIKARWGELAEEDLVPFSEIVSTLPIPSGTSIISSQAAVYWDGVYLHVWYGATTGGDINDAIYYTKASSPFTNWDTPIKVIDMVDGIRDPTIFIEGDNIYLFCQCFDGKIYRPIRLYKISKTADFTNPSNYAYIGVVIDVGAGTYDENMVASPCVVKIGGTYYLTYEAFSSDWVGSIGRAKSTNIESLPWIKDGQLRDTNGNVIYNPSGGYQDIVPDTFADQDTLFIHYYDGSRWNERYVNGDIPNNSMVMSDNDIDPNDGYLNHNNIAHIGKIDGVYYFLMQSWNDTSYLRLYASTSSAGDTVALSGHSRTDFGDVGFTDDDGVTLLDYWMESKVDGDYAVFWVKVKDDLSSSPATIYVYYGKNDANTNSNGDNTFLLFDDFLGGSLDINKWTSIIRGRGGSVSVANSEVTLNPSDNTISSASILSVATFTNDILIRIKRKYSAGTEYYLDTSLGAGGVVDENGETSWWWHTTLQSGYWWLYQQAYYVEGLWRMPATGGKVELSNNEKNLFDTSYKIHDLTYESNGVLKWIVNGKQQYSATDSNFLTNNKKILISQGEYQNGWGADTVIDYVFVRKYVGPEPAHGSWGSEEISNSVMIDQAFVSDERADVGGIQTIGFHAKWNNNGSDVAGGSIYINNTEYITNSTGWVAFNVNSSFVGKDVWIITGVNCNGVTTYMQTAQAPSIVWDQIKIIEGDTTKESLTLGETATIWFKAIYEYDNAVFTSANGILYLNGSAMTWSATNTRWEYTCTATAIGTATFTISGVYDESHGLTTINDTVGAQSITVWSTPFSVISNSTISELTFNSTSKTLTFIVSGPTGTTGCTNVTIAKTLIGNLSELKIYLDGNQIEYMTTSTEYAWLIHITYHHSTHKVVMVLSSLHANSSYTVSLEATTIFSGIIIVIIAAILLAYRKKFTKRYPTHRSQNAVASHSPHRASRAKR
jgi:hypothetical protein